MGRGKRSELTTDDLLRLQEVRPAKRIRSSYGDKNSTGSEAELSDSGGIPAFPDVDESPDVESLGACEEGPDHYISEARRSMFSPHIRDPVKPTELPLNEVQSFSEMGISVPLEAALHRMSIHTPTEVQAACIPPLLSGMLSLLGDLWCMTRPFAGRDCIGHAKTGSGKTIAFALPILQKLSVDPYGIFALVLTPTRYIYFLFRTAHRLT